MSWWTTKEKAYETPYGTIYYGGYCRDTYDNMVIYDQPPSGGSPVRLQRPAMKSFRECEKKLGKIIPLTGSWRSCDYQQDLFAQDPQRYADPKITGHPRGLAIDVSTAISFLRKRRIKRALLAHGWHQVRPDEEPWHFSFFIEV